MFHFNRLYHVNFRTLILGCLLICSAVARAELSEEEATEKSRALEAFFATRQENFKKTISEEDKGRFFLAPGVIADKQNRTVEIDVFTTDVAKGAITEFYLITKNSGHEYEALFQTFALAGDIEKAINFISVEPGTPIDYSKYQFWPKGELLEASFKALKDGAKEIALSSLIQDTVSGYSHDNKGFTHIGGKWLDDGSMNVDSQGAGSIISAYNESITILDVPRLASQDTVYETNVASANVSGTPFEPGIIILKPEKRSATASAAGATNPENGSASTLKRVYELPIKISESGICWEGAKYSPLDTIKALTDKASMSDGFDVYLEISWEDAATFRTLRTVAKIIETLESCDPIKNGSIRVDSPPAGFPYYKALIAPEKWRDRSKRFSQPCELKLDRKEDGSYAATLVAIKEIWKDDQIKPTLEATEFPVENIEAFKALLKEKSPPGLNVLLVFVPSVAPYGQLRPYLDAVRATHPLVQIFID